MTPTIGSNPGQGYTGAELYTTPALSPFYPGKVGIGFGSYPFVTPPGTQDPPAAYATFTSVPWWYLSATGGLRFDFAMPVSGIEVHLITTFGTSLDAFDSDGSLISHQNWPFGQWSGVRGSNGALTLTLHRQTSDISSIYLTGGGYVVYPGLGFETGLLKPDIVPTAPTWNTTGSSEDAPSLKVDYGYEIRNVNLPQTTTVALYWAKLNASSGYDRLDADPRTPGIVDPLHITPTQRAVGTPAPTHFQFGLTDRRWENIPWDATHIIVVADPENRIDEGPQGEANNISSALRIPLAWLARVQDCGSPLSPQVRSDFQSRVIAIANGLKTHPNYLMTVMAVETNGRIDPKSDETERGTRSVGLIHWIGESAAFTLNAVRSQLNDLLLSSGVSQQSIDALNIPSTFNDKNPNHGILAQNIILMFGPVQQLTLVEQFLYVKLRIQRFQDQIATAQDRRGIQALTIPNPHPTPERPVLYAPTNLGDLYGLILSWHLIDVREGETVPEEFGQEGRLTVGQIRDRLEKSLFKGWSLYSL